MLTLVEENPFPMSAYISPNYFCDRENETKRLEENIHNGINSTIFAIRRIGKTGLVNHLFDKLTQENTAQCIYFDILYTQNQKDFTSILSNEILKKFPPQKSIGKKFIEAIKTFRPTFSYDALSGTPEVSLDIAPTKIQEKTLQEIFLFLDNQNIKICIAIDEFQQILRYPEKNTESLLRSIIQQLKNIRFIFSGSNQQMMHEIFNNSKRPFFASCQSIHLDKIDNQLYFNFIKKQFNDKKKVISDESISFILDWTCAHTYYTQYVCNKVYSSKIKNIKLTDVQLICKQIITDNEPIYFQYRNLLTDAQWYLLKCIAKETTIFHPYQTEFMIKYKLGSPSIIKRGLEAHLQKEMIYYENTTQKTHYAVYDKFLMRWMQRLP